jgi:uncharacterized protein with von Willebrand factor type A (vWA) domain
LVERLVELGRALREEGIPVGTGAVLEFSRAASLLPPQDLYWAGRLTLVSRREEIPVYDRVFRRLYGAAQPGPRQPVPQRARPVAVAADASAAGDDGSGHAATIAQASRIELLRHKPFDRCTPEELAEVARLAAGFARALPRRRARRRRPASSGSFDLPRTLRRALRTGGEPFDRRFRERRDAPRRLVLLLDVSGSMSGQSRALLHIAHALGHVHPNTRVFCFGTRLTPATRALSSRDPDEALRRLADEVVDRDGGTRIGDSLKAFLDGGGRRGVARGAIVVVCSDGLETGDPEVLRTQMARLARLAHRVVWLNPLKRDQRYEPLARGMQAALPSIDVFAAGDSLAALEGVARALDR